MVVPSVADSRTYLTVAQTAQTADPALWPVPVRSLLAIDRRLHHGDWVWNERGVPAAPVTVRVDLDAQLVSVFRGGHEIAAAVILYGADSHLTPIGRFPIIMKAARHHSHTYDAPMPYMLRLTADGVAIHGSNVRSGNATHGCIGVPTEFARRLFTVAGRGDDVLIVGNRGKPDTA
ncbi:L,D-transpeptidase family protein [Sphingomonas solaris]|uniref:L,D-transpeptidase family protein n=2 Tax=Alterirhizorhabdus solaris TaxID=2529389 RepID=A0A558QY02_9SPHN|nr:L,D-transpeptidase family protein [Sphingomonas solaris]